LSGRLGQHSEKTSFFDFSALFYFLDVFDCVLNLVVFSFYATLAFLLIPRFELREIFRCQWFGIFPIQDGNGRDWRSFRWWGLGSQTKLMRRYYWFFFYYSNFSFAFFELFSFITYFFFHFNYFRTMDERTNRMGRLCGIPSLP